MNRIKIKPFVLLFFVTIILPSCLKGGFKGSKYTDAQGCFSLRVDEKLILQASTPSHIHWRMNDPLVDAYLTITEVESLKVAVMESLAALHYAADRFKLAATGGSLGNWTLQQYQDEQGTGVAVAGQKRGETFYLLLAVGSVDVVQPNPPRSVMGMLLTLKFTQKVEAAFHPNTIEELEDYLDETAHRTGGSISLAVIRDSEIAYTYVTGYADGLNQVPANTQTVYHWLSITKLVTATAVMQLVESGQIDLDAPLYRYVPEIPQDLNFTWCRILSCFNNYVKAFLPYSLS